MRTSLYAALLFAVVIAAPAAADPPRLPGVSIERTAESLSTLILLPSSVNGTLSYKTCLTCRTVTLTATPTSIYRVGNHTVTLVEMAKLFATGRSYQTLVAAKLNAPVLLRLEVYLPETGKE